MNHKTVRASELKVGDVLCPYGSMHFHYPVTQIKHWNTGRTGIWVEETFQAVGSDATYDVATEE